MKFRFLVLYSALALSLACKSQPGSPPQSQGTAPALTVPSTGLGGAPGGQTDGAASGASAAASAANPVGDQAKATSPMMMEMEVPPGTPLEITLETPVASDKSKADDTVRGAVAKAVDVGGMTVIAAGSPVSGTVVDAKDSGPGAGRASIAIRFNRVVVASTPYNLRTTQIVREAEASKGDDGKKIGIAAGATVKTTIEDAVKINAPM
jgi:hypothetical protein